MTQSTSQKHQCFTSEPLGTKPCTSVAGIGATLGKRLEAEGFDTAKTLLGQYLLLKGDEELFVHWFKEICGANSKQAKDCYSCLAEWEDQFITPMSQSYVNSQANNQDQATAQQSNMAAQQQQQQQPPPQPPQQPQQQQPQAAAASAFGAGLAAGDQMPQLMCATELTNLLLEFAFNVFVNKPQDIVEYAATYFQQLHNQRTCPTTTTTTTTNIIGAQAGTFAGPQPAGSSAKRPSSDSQRSNASLASNGSQPQQSDLEHDDDTLDCEPPRGVSFNVSASSPSTTATTTTTTTTTNAQQQQIHKHSYNRRKSVFAEQYDPAADMEDDENSHVVHSKTDEQRQRLGESIKAIFIFRSVEPQDLTHVLDAMFEVKVTAGDIVIRQGDDGDNFYVVERGKFQIYVTNDEGAVQVRGEYENNGSFGELALMYNQPRAASVVALTDGSLWAMDRNTFRRIVLKSAFRKRKEYEALFEKVSVLRGLNGYERMNLCDALESRRFYNNQMIISQGDQANGMYFIESGNVKIVKQLDDGRPRDVAVLGKGDYFGELALINHKPRAASVYAMGDNVKLAFLDTKAFERLLGSCIELMEKKSAIYLDELAHHESNRNV